MINQAYPRPQMVRKHWQSLNGRWKFTFDDERRWTHPSEAIEWSTTIEVPYAPEAKASGLGDQGFHRGCWYQRDIEVDAKDGRVLLHFGAVDYLAQVWVNGHFVARHEGGHTPFQADITHALQGAGLQTITVNVEDDPLDLAKPRGKQDWQVLPHSIWYRISPTEVEDVLYATQRVGECVAFGVAHPTLGQAIQVIATALALPHGSAQDTTQSNALSVEQLLLACRQNMPAFMVPSGIQLVVGPLPRNPNGKIDRALLLRQWRQQHGV